MGAVISDIDPGGGGSDSVEKNLQRGVAGGVAVQGGDVRAYPLDVAGPR